MTEPKGAVILLSGGMDSATAAYEAKNREYNLHFIHISYGQQTEEKELSVARDLANHVDAESFVELAAPYFGTLGGSSLTDESQTIQDANSTEEEVPDTYVPFRNANLLSIAVSYAEANEYDAVFIGAHSEDYSGYPDCRPGFFEAFQTVVDRGTVEETEIEIVAPLAEWSKTEIVERGISLGVPFEKTWSCYRSSAPACGTCDACSYRLEAFQQAGETDPLEYANQPN